MIENPDIAWASTIFDYGGYAYMSREYIKGLIDRGLSVGVESIIGVEEISKEDISFFNSLRKFSNGNPVPYMNKDIIKVVAHLPLKNIPKFKHNIIYSMMESKGVNPRFIQHCNQFYDSCWTPTNYNKRVFKEAGMDLPIEVMPIGIDTDFYSKKNVLEDFNLNYEVVGPDENKNYNSEKPEGYKFLSVFRWSFRKGFDALIKAYLKEFSTEDNVSLIIISRHAAMSHNKEFVDAVRNDLREVYYKNSNSKSPLIFWCHDRISANFMPSMYGIGDCFVSCSRGEGFSIPTLEASSVDLPVIAPYHTGFTDYIDKDSKNAYTFDVDEWVVCNDIPEWQTWITRDFFGQEFPKFGEGKVEEIGKLMRKVMDCPEESKNKNIEMKKTINDKYTWNKCIDKAYRILMELKK